MNDQHPGLGAIHTLDERDHQYLAAAVIPESLPATYKTDTSMFPVLNQGQRPSCVSHAIVRLMQIYWFKKTGQIVDFSPRFLHAITAPGMGDSDGRDPRAVMQALKDVGCCTTALLPNDITLSDHDYSRASITQAMLDEAAKYKIPEYQFPGADSYSIRHAIYHRGAVALLFQVGQEWWTPSWLSKDINPVKPPQNIVSGHEVAGEHWGDLDGFENSWSSDWNERGFAEYQKNYHPLQSVCIYDAAIDFNPPAPFRFNHDLSFGMTDPDVKTLQQFLNAHSHPIAPAGQAGSAGHETTFYGSATQSAVRAYQTQFGISPTGYFGPLTRAKVNASL